MSGLFNQPQQKTNSGSGGLFKTVQKPKSVVTPKLTPIKPKVNPNATFAPNPGNIRTINTSPSLGSKILAALSSFGKGSGIENALKFTQNNEAQLNKLKLKKLGVPANSNLTLPIAPYVNAIDVAQNYKYGDNKSLKTARNIGNVAGNVAKYAASYAALGPAVEGIPALAAINNPIAKTLVTESAKDLLIGTPISTMDSINQGLKGKELGKSIASNIALDVVTNLGMFGAGKLIKGLKNSEAPIKALETAPIEAPKITSQSQWVNTLKKVDNGVTATKTMNNLVTERNKISKLYESYVKQGKTYESNAAKDMMATLDGEIAKQTPKVSQYVDTNPITFTKSKNDKATSQNIRDAFVSKENGQIVTGNHLADTMKKLSPNEQEGIQLYIDAGGDMAHLKEMANNPDTIMNSFIPNTKITYRDAYNQALNLSPEAQKAAKMAQQYYTESGAYALKTGSTQSILDNYASRMWLKEPQGVKTEMGRLGLNPNTSHAKERTFTTIGEGLLAGKQPATLKANELLSIHNQELAHANTTRELATALETSGLGKYTNGSVPQGFKSIDGLSKHIPTQDGTLVKNFVLPENLANGLKAITDQDFTKKIDVLRNVQKYQGVVKTVDLAVSTFHHITLAAQALYNNHGGVDFIKHWNDLKLLDTPEFNQFETDFVKHTGTTTKVMSNMDTLSHLTTKGSVMDKLTNLPVLKQGKQLVEANNNLLFGKIQRWLKVTDYQNKIMSYVAKHPVTDDIALSKVKTDIAKEVNLAYGGLNWKSLGKNPSTLSLERLGLLAPDWTESSIRMIGQAFKKGEGGKAARSQYAVGIGGGLLLTEGLNHILTGHFTDQNPKGHELEVEVQPGVYISMFRSGVGDTTKLIGNVVKYGPAGGTVKSLQGKLAPFARTAVGVASNTDYMGRRILDQNKTGLQNTANLASFVGQQAGPIPFGVPSSVKYAQDKNKTPLGTALVGTGAGTYGKDYTQTGSVFDNPKKSYDGNWLRKFAAPSQEKAQIKLENKIGTFTKQNTLDRTAVVEQLGKAIKEGTSIAKVFEDNKVPINQRSSLLTTAKDKFKNNKLTPLQAKYQGMSKANQKVFLNTLSPEERNLLK